MSHISGYNYYKDEDVLIVTLADGSFHAVHTVSSAPTLKYQSDGGEQLTTDALSGLARQIFVALEGGAPQINHLDVMRTSCAISYGDYGTIVWLHELACLALPLCRESLTTLSSTQSCKAGGI